MGGASPLPPTFAPCLPWGPPPLSSGLPRGLLHPFTGETGSPGSFCPAPCWCPHLPLLPATSCPLKSPGLCSATLASAWTAPLPPGTQAGAPMSLACPPTCRCGLGHLLGTLFLTSALASSTKALLTLLFFFAFIFYPEKHDRKFPPSQNKQPPWGIGGGSRHGP